MESFGDRLLEALRKKKLKQTDLLDLLGKTGKNTVNQWVKNRAKPSADDLAKISEVLEVSTDWLLGTKNYNSNPPAKTVNIAMEDYIEYLQLKNDRLKRDNESLQQDHTHVHVSTELE